MESSYDSEDSEIEIRSLGDIANRCTEDDADNEEILNDFSDELAETSKQTSKNSSTKLNYNIQSGYFCDFSLNLLFLLFFEINEITKQFSYIIPHYNVSF